jgi:hypothetical protein
MSAATCRDSGSIIPTKTIMPKDPDKDRPDLGQGDVAGRLDLNPERERLARLIGRLIAWEWLRTRPSNQNQTPNDLELTP